MIATTHVFVLLPADEADDTAAGAQHGPQWSDVEVRLEARVPLPLPQGGVRVPGAGHFVHDAALLARRRPAREHEPTSVTLGRAGAGGIVDWSGGSAGTSGPTTAAAPAPRYSCIDQQDGTAIVRMECVGTVSRRPVPAALRRVSSSDGLSSPRSAARTERLAGLGWTHVGTLHPHAHGTPDADDTEAIPQPPTENQADR